MSDKTKLGNFFGPKFEKLLWYKNTSTEVKNTIGENERLASFLLDTSETNSDFSIERVDYVKTGFSYILVGLEVRSKLNNEIKKVDQVVSIDDVGSQGMGVLVFVVDEKIAYFGLENKKTILGSTEEPRAIQMHFPNFSAGMTLALPANIQKDVDMVLGKDRKVDRFVDLGQIKVNPMLTPDQTSLFALIFDDAKLSYVKTKYMRLVKPEELEEVIKESRDPFLLSVLSKLSSFAII